jgi:hypothetical protein
MSLIDRLHGGFVYSRRVRVRSDQLAELIPQSSLVLDVGFGNFARLFADGLVAWQLHASAFFKFLCGHKLL